MVFVETRRAFAASETVNKGVTQGAALAPADWGEPRGTAGDGRLGSPRSNDSEAQEGIVAFDAKSTSVFRHDAAGEFFG